MKKAFLIGFTLLTTFQILTPVIILQPQKTGGQKSINVFNATDKSIEVVAFFTYKMRITSFCLFGPSGIKSHEACIIGPNSPTAIESQKSATIQPQGHKKYGKKWSSQHVIGLASIQAWKNNSDRKDLLRSNILKTGYGTLVTITKLG